MTAGGHKSIKKADRVRLIEAFAQSDQAVPEVAAALGLTLPQLAAWAAEPGTLATLERLARLADVRAQIMVSRFRANAAIRLIQIAAGEDASELSRKACVDLLTVDLNAFASSITSGGSGRPAGDSQRGPHGFPYMPEHPSPRGEAAILRALEKLGQDDSSAASQ
jgi:hypothetical protein